MQADLSLEDIWDRCWPFEFDIWGLVEDLFRWGRGLETRLDRIEAHLGFASERG